MGFDLFGVFGLFVRDEESKDSDIDFEDKVTLNDIGKEYILKNLVYI